MVAEQLMDLGISGRWALVSASSRGLGRACAEALVREGVNVVITGRRHDVLETAASELKAIRGGEVRAVACDITTPGGRAAALESCPQVDILINNAAGPAPGNFRDWDRETWIAALDANMLTPIELIRSVIDPMMDRGFGRIVNITSGAVKAPIETLGLSNGARSGLTGFVAGISRQTIGRGVTINNLLPGAFDTDRLRALTRAAAASSGDSEDSVRAKRALQIPARRMGNPAEFGAACAFLCSVHAGYITGQNWLLDGGAYPGTF